MGKEKIMKTTGVHLLSENEWMVMFRVSSQWYESTIEELMLRDENILQKRELENSESADFVRH